MHMKTFSAGHALEPYYVRPGDTDDVFQRVSDRTAAAAAAAASTSAAAVAAAAENAAAAAVADSAGFVPLLLVGFAFMSAYIACGAAVLHRLDAGAGDRTYLDCVFFCFMLLSTIGYGNSRPLEMTLTSTATVWFCSVYILSGMALTAMCFNIVHRGVSTKLRTLYQQQPPPPSSPQPPTESMRGGGLGGGTTASSISDLTLRSNGGVDPTS